MLESHGLRAFDCQASFRSTAAVRRARLSRAGQGDSTIDNAHWSFLYLASRQFVVSEEMPSCVGWDRRSRLWAQSGADGDDGGGRRVDRLRRRHAVASRPLDFWGDLAATVDRAGGDPDRLWVDDSKAILHGGKGRDRLEIGLSGRGPRRP